MLVLTNFLGCVTNIYPKHKKPVQSSQKEERTMPKVVSMALFLLNMKFTKMVITKPFSCQI